MQQWWFDVGLVLKSVIYDVFLPFSPYFEGFHEVFMNMQMR